MAVAQQNRLGAVLTVLGAAIIVAATLSAAASGPGVVDAMWCLACGDYGGQDLIANVLLFLPLGAGLRLAGVSRLGAIVLAAATSLTIESLQLTIIAGRDASLGDLAANVLGGALGVLLVATRRSWLVPAPDGARVLAWVGAVAWLTIQAGTAAGLVYSLPLGPYWGQWAPHRVGRADFRGVTLWARLDGAPLPIGIIERGSAAYDALRRDTLLLEAGVVPGPAPAGAGSIVRVATGENKVLNLSQQGRDLAVSARLRANGWRLRSPVLRLERVFPDVDAARASRVGAGETLRVSGGVLGDRLVASAATDASGGPSRSRRTELGLTPGLGWSLVLPAPAVTRGEALMLSALWAAALLVPLGYWSRRGAAEPALARPRRTSRIAWPAARALAAATLGLGGVPLAFQLPPVHWSEWVGALAGLAAGWMLGRRSLRASGGRHAEPSR